MPFQIQYIDEVRLPVWNPTQDHSPAGGESGLVAGAGGVFDKYGDQASNPTLDPIVISGDVLGDTSYLGDETGDYVVDESGGRILAGDSATMLRSYLAAMKGRVRKRGKLWRVQLDDGRRQWKTARFLRMSQPQIVRDRLFKAHVTCTFESAMANWRSETPITFTAFAFPEAAAVVVVHNPGETVNDAIVTITCTGGSITWVEFRSDELGVRWTWSASIQPFVSGSTLIVNAGSQGVNMDGAVDAYNFFFRFGSAPGWMPIPQGTWPFEVSVIGGNATVQVQFYPQFP